MIDTTVITHHVAQVNIGRIKASLSDPLMEGFVSRLDDMNALADRSPGFIWRLQSEEGNATYVRPYGDDRVLMNMSVWESIETLRQYVFGSAHLELLRRRGSWFERFEGTYTALWWIPVGWTPTVDEAKERLAHLDLHGPTNVAFTFQKVFAVEAVS